MHSAVMKIISVAFADEGHGLTFEQAQGSLLEGGLFWLHADKLYVAQAAALCSLADILRFNPDALSDSQQCISLLYQVMHQLLFWESASQSEYS